MSRPNALHEMPADASRLLEMSPDFLRALGVTLAIDDFGTGWSSLRVLLLAPRSR